MTDKENELLLDSSNTDKIGGKENEKGKKKETEHGNNNENENDVRKLIVKYGTLVDILGDAFKIFTKYVEVFDLYFVATTASPDDKVLHGATVFYQYIDNDGDGLPDNRAVYTKLKENKATMVMFSTQEELEAHSEFFDEIRERDDIIIQDLEADETRPGSLRPYEFDEALEECFHLVTQGYCMAYPHVFGLKHGSAISLMMDCARGGYFKEVPVKYPDSAWYTYYDKSCDYQGMIVEYIYWAMLTILGAQKFRRCEIGKEWRPCTRHEIKITDYPVYSLLTDPLYRLPTKLPVPVARAPFYVPKTTVNRSGNVKTSYGCGCCGNYQDVIRKQAKRIKCWWRSILK